MEGMTFVVITTFVTEFFKDSLRLSVDLLATKTKTQVDKKMKSKRVF